MSSQSQIVTQTPKAETSSNLVCVEFGDYWQYAPAQSDDDEHEKLVVGNIYIVVDVLVNVITDEIQTVEIYQPKTEGSGGRHRFHIDTFLADFKPMPKEQAESVRKSDLAKLESEAKTLGENIQLALSDPRALLKLIGESEDEEIVQGRNELHQGLALPSPEMLAANGSAIISASDSSVLVDKQKKQLENQVVLGNLANALASSQSRKLELTLAKTSDLLMENAKAIEGKARDMTRKVKGVMRKVRIMELYLGEKVTVLPIREGIPADHSVKFSFNSQMVYIDDEIATERIFADGSFDFESKADFFNLLKDNQQFMERILPHERSIVTIRPTRTGKSYSDIDPHEAAKRNDLNKSAFLLVRDGQKVTAIISPLDYKTRLFPTDNEMASFFENIWATNNYLVNKQRDFERMADGYHGVVAILQGVKDRQQQGGEEVFGELPMEGHGRSFIEESYVKSNCHFINDEDNLLANKELPDDIHQWIKLYSSEANHVKGDIVVYRKAVLSRDWIPGAYTYSSQAYEYVTVWSVPFHDDEYKESRVSLFKGEPIIKVELESGYPVKRQNFRAFINRVEQRILNIMRIPPSILDRILQSRSLRSTLCGCGYMELLVEARAVIARIKAETKSIFDSLKLYYPGYSDDAIHLLVMDWYRNQKSGDIAAARVKQIVTRIVSQHNKSIAYSDSMIEQARDSIATGGEKPIYASKYQGRLFIFTSSVRAVSSYQVSFAGIDHPFFNMYLVSIDGSIENQGIVGAEIQQYPVSFQFVEELREFGLQAERLTGENWQQLANSSKTMHQNFDLWLGKIYAAVNSQDDQQLLSTIHYFIERLNDVKKHTKHSQSHINYGIPILPAQVTKHRGESVINGLSFNFPRAIAFLYDRMSEESKLEHYDEIDDKIDGAIDWMGMLDDLRDRPNPNTSGKTPIIGLYRQSITTSFLSHLIYTEQKVYRTGERISESNNAACFALSEMMKRNCCSELFESVFFI